MENKWLLSFHSGWKTFILTAFMRKVYVCINDRCVIKSIKLWKQYTHDRSRTKDTQAGWTQRETENKCICRWLKGKSQCTFAIFLLKTALVVYRNNPCSAEYVIFVFIFPYLADSVIWTFMRFLRNEFPDILTMF